MRPKRRNDVLLSSLVNWTARQTEAWDSLADHRYLLFGGARGGGKSYWLRWTLLLLLLYWYKSGLKNVHVGLFCSTYPELQDRQISKIANEFPQWLGEIKDTQEAGLGFYLKDEYGGGVILLRNLDKPEKYKSAEFAAIGVDELTLILKDVFDTLRGSLRWPGIKRPLFIGATNPDGIGNAWVRELWIESTFPPEMQDISSEFHFVQALPTDNPYLDASYIADLRSQPKDVQKAWIDGDWYVFRGQVFKSFRRDKHVIDPIEIPDSWIKTRGIDWGSAAPFVCLWTARNPQNGRVYVYRELYEVGLSDRDQARMIKDSTPPNEKINITFADPSMWTGRTDTHGVTFSSAQIYSQNGVPLTRADNNRLDGKRRVERLLEPLEDGLPGLQIFNSCTNLIRTLPNLVYSKTQPEDVDTSGDDHSFDSLKYSLSAVSEYHPPARVIQNRRSPITQLVR